MLVATVHTNGDTKVAVILDWIVSVKIGFRNNARTVELVPLMGEPIVVWEVTEPSSAAGPPDYAEKQAAIRDAAGSEVERWVRILQQVPSPVFQMAAM